MYREFDRHIDGLGWVTLEVEWSTLYGMLFNRERVRAFRMDDRTEIRKDEVTPSQYALAMRPVVRFEIEQRAADLLSVH